MSDNRLVSRRNFVKTSLLSTGAIAVPTLGARMVHAGGNDTLRVGLIGCGGRGTAAVSNAIESSPNVTVVALADLAQSRLDGSRESLRTAWEEKGNYAVTDDQCFVGVDAYKQLCAHPDIDIVIHTTPPGLRFLTLREAIQQGKHSFVEKPVCVDAYTYRHVLESGKLADENGLAIVSGTQYRRETSYRDAIDRLHEGVIGELLGAFAYYCTGDLWLRGNEAAWEQWGGFDGMEYQMRNWLYFTWLSGDHIAEQAIHNIDAINWGFDGTPEVAFGSGGRLKRTDPKYGDIYDHFSIDYDYPGGKRVSFKCRQVGGAKGLVRNRFIGTKGTMEIRPAPGSSATIVRDHKGNVVWHNNGRINNNAPYVQEHRALIESIRDGRPIQEIQGVADSSLTAVIGREAAYSGQKVRFDWTATESQQKLVPEVIQLGTNPVRPVPIPGVYKLS